MSLNALFARVKRAAPASFVAASFAIGAPAFAQQLNPTGPARTPAPDNSAAPADQPTGAIIKHIVVDGTQRIEPATVLSYISVHEGDPYRRAGGRPRR